MRSPMLDRLDEEVLPPVSHGGHPPDASRSRQAASNQKQAASNRSQSASSRRQSGLAALSAAASAQPQSTEARVGIPLPGMAGRCDIVLLAALCGLLCFGLVMVYSASTEAVPGDPSYWFRRELLWVALGLAALFVTMRVPYSRWRRLSVYVMVGALVLLALVLVVGKQINGAQRWLAFGSFFSFQPSELAKLAFILYIADWLSRKGRQVGSFTYGLVPFALLTGLVLALVMLQNDLGTAVIIATFALAMFVTAGANYAQLLPMLFSGMLSLGFIILHTPFRMARLHAFQDPLNCLAQGSYQVCQGLIALGSGGVSGIGLGASRQKAGYLPNPWTDSIFAIVGEELGFLGCLLIVLLIVLFASRAIRVGRRAPDMYGILLATGITCWIATQALLNIGSVIAFIPFTGVPLPFVSFGGSSLVTTMAAVGLILNISRYSPLHSQRPAREGQQSSHQAQQLSHLGTENHAGIDLRRRNGRAYLPSPGRRQRAEIAV
jgi:cell division protein FtsW